MKSPERYIEDEAIAFAMYCDDNGLSLDEGRELADRISQELEATADGREAYLPDAQAAAS